MLGRLFISFGTLGLAACANGTPDLTIAELNVNPPSVAVGDAVVVASAIANDGDEAVAPPDGVPFRVTTELTLTSRATSTTDTLLTTWRTDADQPLRPDDVVRNTVSISVPRFIAAGPYDICATVEPTGSINDGNPSNNERCVPLTVLAAPPARADLVVSKVTVVEHNSHRAKLDIDLKNIGAASTGPFKVLAFRRSPRWPVSLQECNDNAQCSDLWVNTALAPGEEQKLTGWVSLNFDPVNTPYAWNGKGPENESSLAIIDVMADGCFHKTDTAVLESHCRVEETDELNNFFEVPISE